MLKNQQRPINRRGDKSLLYNYTNFNMSYSHLKRHPYMSQFVLPSMGSNPGQAQCSGRASDVQCFFDPRSAI